ncbi:MAG: type II secretion system F family protein, partial [Verrucomicrobium sp.]
SASITQMHDLQSRVVGALVYPAFMFGALILLLVVFSTVLLPGFSDMLSKSRTKLPIVMETLINTTNFMKHWWWLGVAIIVTVVLLFRAYISKESGRLWWDQFKLKLPLFGPVLAARFYAQFSASLGNLINNGIPLLNALRLTAKATSNIFLRGLLNQATAHLGEGVSLSSALRKVGHLPVLLVDMIAMGEQTGRLGKSLEKIAARFDKDLDGKVKRVTALITPIVLIILFVVVGVVAISIVTAIFETMTSVRARS